MNELQLSMLNEFNLDSELQSCAPYGNGHINVTYLATTVRGTRYIVQKINENTFRDVEGLMDNISRVTGFLHKCSPDPRSVLTLIPTKDDKSFLRHKSGYWRVYSFIEDSLCLQLPETDNDFYESAVAFGRFQQHLKDFPAQTLHEVIPNFHNTPDRYRIFKETLRRDPVGRASGVAEEIEFFMEREEEMATLQSLRSSGELPTRVTHNDTKLNNVLLDRSTRKALCVIDLDTVMPGLSLFDFGDSIRFGAATALEDEKDLSKMTLSLDRYRTFTKGFLCSCPGLTQAELEYLPLGAKTMTLECGLRFLTDYLDGDKYFAIHKPEHNLDRTRTQIRLVEDMEKKWDEMHRIVWDEKQ